MNSYSRTGLEERDGQSIRVEKGWRGVCPTVGENALKKKKCDVMETAVVQELIVLVVTLVLSYLESCFACQ
ncbi:hypothetical protein MSG28_011608 [Choristoneura fumiferana]|uniref:Uncharacterized protein n=1 Tax=Choristoneura fumiferana TaxID=7141 RepID=A0ACC0JNW2_CHOFU|nr:hypothetical protein MSG28_011608 [Choristoneura fumiferana]